MVEHRPCNPVVMGSIPIAGSMCATPPATGAFLLCGLVAGNRTREGATPRGASRGEERSDEPQERCRRQRGDSHRWLHVCDAPGNGGFFLVRACIGVGGSPKCEPRLAPEWAGRPNASHSSHLKGRLPKCEPRLAPEWTSLPPQPLYQRLFKLSRGEGPSSASAGSHQVWQPPKCEPRLAPAWVGRPDASRRLHASDCLWVKAEQNMVLVGQNGAKGSDFGAETSVSAHKGVAN